MHNLITMCLSDVSETEMFITVVIWSADVSISDVHVYNVQFRCLSVNNHIARLHIFLIVHSYKLNESWKYYPWLLPRFRLITSRTIPFLSTHKFQVWHDHGQPWPHMSTTRNISSFFPTVSLKRINKTE